MQTGRRKAACETCHARKVRCDISETGPPCTNCQKGRLANCRIHQKTRQRRQDKQSNRQIEPAVGSAVQHSASENWQNRREIPQHATQLPPTVEDTGRDELRTHLVEFVEQPALHERAIDRDARVTYIGSDVSNLNFLIRHTSTEQGERVVHQPSNRFARRNTAYEPDRLPADALQLPEKPVVDQLLSAYFDHVNPGFPVVDKTRFMSTYGARDPQNPPSLLLLQSMLIVGAHVSYDSSQRQREKAIFFRRAKALFDARFERNRDIVVQAALLLSWHTDGTEDVAANAWFWTHTASTIAFGLGMHRNAEPSKLVAHNKRMWRRVFWLLFTCDVAVALQYGRPQAIRLDECDVLPLRSEDFQDCDPDVQIDYVMQSVQLSKIISDALRHGFGPSAAPEQQELALQDADTRLASWTLDLPDALRLRPTLTLDLHATELHLVYNAFLISLHRPRPPGSGQQNDPTREDADICSAAASHIQSLAEALRERDMIRLLPSSSVHVLFTAMIQLSAEVRTANPVLAASAQRRYDSTLLSLRALAEVWPHGTPVAYYFEHQKLQKERHPPDTALPSPIAPRELNTGLDVPMRQLVSTDPAGSHAGSAGFDAERQDHSQDAAPTFANTDWHSLFPSSVLDGANDFASMDSWRTLYWQGAGFEDLSPDFRFDI